MRRVGFLATLVCLLTSLLSPAMAQETAVRGAISGTVEDPSGAVIAGAKVIVAGPVDRRETTTGEDGTFFARALTPGKYTIKVEMSGFKAAEIKDVEVFVGKTSTIRVVLQPGQITETVTVAATSEGIDVQSTAIGANLNDTLYERLPLARNVTSLFYLAPGVNDGLGSGAANPSISGASGLENLYVADGVNITDSAFGGLGVFSRVYGPLATGINQAFIKEVQVKTGGFEPQYGKSTGGIVNIITKSGGRDFHGAFYAYYSPEQFEAERKQPDDFRINKAGRLLHTIGLDYGLEAGGYVPGFRDKLFWFGSFNPSFPREVVLAPQDSGLNRLLGEFQISRRVLNYAAKLTYNISQNHTFNASIFGDPTLTNQAPHRTLNIDNLTATSQLKYGTRNITGRYNGNLSPTWILNSSFSWGFNSFDERNFADLYQITDLTQTAGLPGQRGAFRAVGLGFFEPTKSNHYTFDVGTTKQYSFIGSHEFNLGYQYEYSTYRGRRERSGPRFTIPATNASGIPISQLSFGGGPDVAGQPSNATFELRIASPSCTLCPLMRIPGFRDPQPVFLRQNRGEFGAPNFSTASRYHTGYVLDRWSPSKRFTINLGLRWEQERVEGEAIQYSFTGNWSPRIGLTVDPWGDRKTKLYANFGRYHNFLPLDVAERSLTNELDFIGARWAPAFVVRSGRREVVLNEFGTVTPVLDAAHLLTGAAGGTGTAIFVSAQSTTGIAAGTKLGYADEFIVGFERELPGGIIFSVRYLDRRLKRIIEDVSGIPPEGANFGLNQIYLIANPSRTTDLFTNPISQTLPPTADPAEAERRGFVPVEDTFGRLLGFVKYLNPDVAGADTPDGKPDGFPDPVHVYQAVEIEFNKRFSHNWMMLANWRIAKLFGNFEGYLRNDNGQTDPGISSLFDFVEGDFGLLGDQFKPGVLNTDRRHVVNFYAAYTFDRWVKDLTLATGIRVQSGIPINDLKAHPAYLNAGEVPVGGRGALGRTPVTGSVDAHLDYPFWRTERWKFKVSADFFNVGNSKRVTRFDEFEDISFGTKNLDFRTPRAFQNPLRARIGLKLEF
jgi:hypothetical protein